MAIELAVFRLLDKNEDPDSFFLNENKTKDHSRKIGFAGLYAVKNPVSIKDKSTGAVKWYQYIPGVDVLEVEEQKKRNITFDPLEATIFFEDGEDIIFDKKDNPILKKFLDIHPNNAKSENHIKGLHEAIFYEYVKADEIQSESDVFDKKDKAIEVLQKLKGQQQRLLTVAKMFSVCDGIDDAKEAYVILRKFSEENAEQFLATIANRESQVMADVNKAIEYGIFTEKTLATGIQYDYDAGGILFLAEKTKVTKDARGKLIDFLVSEEGSEHYKQITGRIKKAEVDLLQTA